MPGVCSYGYVPLRHLGNIVMRIRTATITTTTVSLHGPSMFAIKAKIYGVLCKQSSSTTFDETSSYWSAPKTPNFSAFHWSLRGSLVSIGQNFVATRVVHLPKSTETSLITESDQGGPNYQLLQLCTVRTAWSESDQAVWALHSCNSWLVVCFGFNGPLRQYFSLYRAVSQRKGEREEKG